MNCVRMCYLLQRQLLLAGSTLDRFVNRAAARLVQPALAALFVWNLCVVRMKSGKIWEFSAVVCSKVVPRVQNFMSYVTGVHELT